MHIARDSALPSLPGDAITSTCNPHNNCINAKFDTQKKYRKLETRNNYFHMIHRK